MSEPTEREWLEGLRYEDKFPEAGDGGRVPDVSEQRAEAIGAYLAQYPPSGFTDRYSAAGWSHIARGVLSAAAVFAAEAPDPASVLAALLAESPEATVAAIEALLTSDEAVEVATADTQSPLPLVFWGGVPGGVARRAIEAACRSLLSKVPKGDGDA
jgi:hypothetical protein